MRRRELILLLSMGLGACESGSLANREKPMPTGGQSGQGLDAAMASDSGGNAADSAVDTTRPDPLFAAATCTSKTVWSNGENALMAPGQACIACHERSGEGPLYTLAGTLYPTGHEPDNCNGASGTAGAKVVVTGSNGSEITLTPNAAGNFYTTQRIFLPYTVKIVDGAGVERPMLGSTSDGDCNSCHTQSGSLGAPGRVTLP